MPIDYSKPNPLRNPDSQMSGPSIEVVHQQQVEVEQEVVTDVQVNQEIETTQTINQQVEITGTYTGDLVDYTIFNTEDYKNLTRTTLRGLADPDAEVEKLYGIISKENFANIPRAIKYLSPAAAEEMAKRLPAYVSLDINNLPLGFSCSKTPRGEIVLDYDSFAGDELENRQPFSLHTLDQDIASFEDLEFEEDRGDYACYYWRANPADYPDFSLGMCRLVKDERYEDFQQNLAATDPQFFREPRFIFLYENYLGYLSDCNQIIDGNFYRRVHEYDELKYKCLELFLKNTGSSCHDINKTLDDFEIFWAELENLCNKRGVDIKKFQANFLPPAGGHPAVYMRRLLHILTAARDLEEQFVALKGLDLGQNGAYYAMCVEGFKVVSALMNLNYNPDEQNSLEYTETRDVYKISWDKLFEKRGSSIKGFEFASLYRFAAQQDKSIDINNLQKIFEEVYDKINIDKSFKSWLFAPYTLILFSVIHQGYLDEKQISGKSDDELLSKEFIQKAYRATQQPYSNKIIFKHLQNLFERDIKLNTSALAAVTNILSGLNSCQIESVEEDRDAFKKKLIDDLFGRINADKHSALRFLFVFGNIDANNKFPIDYILDMADYLAEDEAEVEALYKQDLLVLALLFAANKSALYVKRMDKPVPELLYDIKQILIQAASGNPESELMRYAIRHIILGGKFVRPTSFIQALREIALLNDKSPLSTVNNILKNHGLYQAAAKPVSISVDMQDLHEALLNFIIKVAQQTEVLKEYIRLKNPDINIDESEENLINSFSALLVDDLGAVVTTVIEQADPHHRTIYNLFLTNIYNDYRDTQVVKYFTQESTEVSRKIAEDQFKKLHFIQVIADYDDLKTKLSDMQGIADLFTKLLKTRYIQDNQEQLSSVLREIKPNEISKDFLWNLFSFGVANNKVEYLPVFAAFLNLPQDSDITDLCNYTSQLAGSGFPVPYLEKFVKIYKAEEFDDGIFITLQEIFAANPADPVLSMLFASRSAYSLQQILEIVSILPLQTELLNREKLANFIKSINCIDDLPKDDPARAQKYLYILTKIFSQAASENLKDEDYKNLITSLDQLTKNEIDELQQLYTKSNVSFSCLRDGLAKKQSESLEFTDLLEDFEKNPFGNRPANIHDKSQVERVINGLYDRVNDSVHPYAYRKQIMEAFLFVDACGADLKAFSGKAAEELNNQELQEAFLALKNKEDKTFEEWLLGLALIREAMYRSTGKYAYSTQIIALIESMLHEGDTLTNIETGQGKSITDAMHASLLWLGSDHVTVTVPSQVDSGRDLAEFGGCFDLLGIKHGLRPLCSVSKFDEFLTDGINFISFSHLGLLDNRARVAGLELLGGPETKASLIINESDETILNDRVVCRLALTDPDAPSPSQFWIYDEVNDFIDNLADDPSQEITIQADIDSLRQHLLDAAFARRVNQKQREYIQNLDPARLWVWMCSAKRVKGLNVDDKDDYVISEKKEYKNIDGMMCLTNVVNLVMQDKQISLESQYGEGAMQLLYSRLNRDRSLQSRGINFVIPRESKTVLSSTNRVLIKKFQERRGVVRGSSATTGSPTEIAYQNQEYGFGATTIPPHQISKMVVHRPLFADSDADNVKNIKKILKKSPAGRPKLIICGSIAEARDLYNKILFDNQFDDTGCQLFTGKPNEEQEVIQKAATPGMITISTPALGRNKDVRYLRNVGMNVIHTSIQEDRLEIQGNGRTAREGSPGDVYYCLSTAKYGNDKDAVKQRLYDANKLARERNQWVHDLLNYLLVAVEHGQDENFFHNQWSEFSKDWEAQYQEHMRGKADIELARSDFINILISDFNSKFARELNFADVLIFMQKKHTAREQYFECNQDVKMADCMQPEIIALRVVPADKQDTLFENLPSSPENQDRTKFFTTAFAASEKSYWFQTPLTNLMQDKASLRLLREVSSEQDPVNDIEIAKRGVKLLINEYLSANYFINSSRKAFARQLLKDIDAVNNTQDLYKLITKTQLLLANQDIETNKTRWRSLHFFGRSRLQESLSLAVILIRTLDKSIKRDTEVEIVDGKKQHISSFTYDSSFKETLFKADKSNAKVIHTSIQSEEVFEQEEDRERGTFSPRKS